MNRAAPRRRGLALLPLALCCLAASPSCTLDAFLFNASHQDGPYDFSSTTIPADRFTTEGDFVTAADGTRVHLHYVLPSGADPARATTTVFYCHGNRDHLFHYWNYVEALYDLGYGVLVFDYRGYGRSDGTPTEAGLYQDAEAALAFLLDQPGVDARRLVYLGNSLGAAVCTELAHRHAGELAALVLGEPFTSISDMVADGATVSLPADFVTTLVFDNEAKIDAVGAPVLLLHGSADDYLTPDYSRALYEHALPPKELHLVPGANHGDLMDPPYRDFVKTTVSAFLDQHVP